MKRLTLQKITDSFAAHSAADSADYSRCFQGLSAALHDLQQAGIDVELQLFGKSTEQGFKMRFNHPIELVWQNTGGILRIGNFHGLVAIFTELKKADHDKEPCFWLKVSELDIRFEHNDNTIRHSAYDLLNDEDALISLQKFVISIAGNQQAIADADVHNAFQLSAHRVRPTKALAPARLGKKTSPLAP